MQLTYRRASEVDSMRFTPFMREVDLVEVRRLSGGASTRELLAFSIRSSDEAFVVCDPAGSFVAIGGVGQVSEERGGVPWLLCTDLVDKHRKSVLRLCRTAVSRWEVKYPSLRNAMDPANTSARRLIRALGFTELPVTPNVRGFPLLPFYRLSPSTCVTSPQASP